MREDRAKPLTWRAGLKRGTVIGLIGGCFLFPQLGGRLAVMSFDSAFLFRPDSPPVHETCTVYMDRPSHEALGIDRATQWNLDRHADLMDRLIQCQAKVVVFDVLFLSNRNAQAAARFVDAVRRHGRVVVGTMIEQDFMGTVPDRWTVVGPFAALDEVAYSGLVEEGVGEVLRQHFFSKGFQDPGMSYVAADLYLGQAPRDPWRARWINMEPPDFIPSYSYHNVIGPAPNVPCQSFSNKVVFIGGKYYVGTTGGGTDFAATPYTWWTKEKSPGVDVNASSFLNFVRKNWLIRLGPIQELTLIILTGIILGLGFYRFSPPVAIGSGLVLLFLVAACSIYMVWTVHYWYSWLVVCLIQIPAAVGWTVYGRIKQLQWAQWLSEQQKKQLAKEKEILGQLLSDSGRAPSASSARSASGDPPPPLDATASMPLHPAQTLVKDCQLLRSIGSGAYGEVWMARDLVGSLRAVKLIFKSKFPDPAPYDREFKGIKKYAPISLSHPGLMPILHVGQNEEKCAFYYIMEIGDDEKSGQKINPDNYSARSLSKDFKTGRPFSIRECLDIFIALADSLEYLHQNRLVHRDIKPSNVIFVAGKPKLVDVGLVTDLSHTAGDVSAYGTFHYMAPEGPGTPGADVYGLGKLMYVTAFSMDAASFPDLPSRLSEESVDPAFFSLNKIIVKACEPNKSDRYQSAADLLADLMGLRDQLAVTRGKTSNSKQKKP